MPFTKFGAEIFRDYISAGIPGSGAWDVVKADMRAWMAAVEDEIDAEVYVPAGWVTATAYAVNEVVWHNSVDYICIAAHTSGASTEPGIGVDWEDVWALFGQDLNPSGNFAAPGIAFGGEPGTGLTRVEPGVLGIGTLGTGRIRVDSTRLAPVTHDGLQLGSAAISWADYFGAMGHVFNLGAGNYTVTHSAGNLAFSGAITLGIDLAVTEGGTGASTPSDARTNLGLVIGTDVQPFDATLLSLALLGTAADRIAYTTGVDTWAETPLTAFARTLLDDTTAGGVLTTLGVSAFIQTLLDDAAASNARTTLGVAIGADVQAWDADLDALAGIASSGILARTGAGTAAARTITGTANEITVANGDGVSGNPTLSLPSGLTFTGKTVTGGTFSGAATTGTFDVQQALAWSGFITPAALSGDVNDYAPAGFATASTLRLDGGAGDRNITGIAGGAEGRIIVIHNIGATNNITLVTASASSTAANRFETGANVTLTVNQTAALRYDGQSSRWRLLAGPGSGGGGGSGTVTSIAVGTGLTTGGGAITSSGTISLDFDALTQETAIVGTADFLPVYDTSAAAHRKVLPQNLTQSGGLQLLASGTVTNAATLDIVLTAYTGYRGLKFVLQLIPQNDAVTLACQLSTNSGVSYDAGASDYDYRNLYLTSVAVTNFVAAADLMVLSGQGANNLVGNGASEGWKGHANLLSQANAALRPTMDWQATYIDSNASSRSIPIFGSGGRHAIQDTDAIRFFFPGGGNIASGNWAVYGFA